jgi:phosphatidylinositol alpha-1,6-mannosyltransferase
MGTQFLLSYDFPPMGGGIARFMGELTKRYAPGSLIVSTGQYPNSAAVDEQLPNRVERLRVPSKRLRTLQGVLLWSRQAALSARSLRPEFIWCGNFKPAAYPAKWVQRQFGTPYGIMLYGTELLLLQHRLKRSVLKRRIARSLLGSAAVLLTISQYTRALCLAVLEDLGFQKGQIDVRVVPLGTDPCQFRPGIDTRAARSRYGLESGCWLLTVARLAAHKGIDTVIRAMAVLRDEYPDLRYAVVGSGIGLAQLQALARSLEVSDRVRFLTDVPDEDLPPLYNSADLYLGVSRPVELMIEGFGISLSEASACGIPVIGSSTGGIPDLVRDGETGLLVDTESPEAVAGAVQLLLRERDLARRLGAAARRAVESFYNWDRVAEDVVGIGNEHARHTASATDGSRRIHPENQFLK